MVSPFLMVTGIMDLTTGQSPGEIPASTLSITTPTIQTSPSREHVLVGEQVTFYINATSDIVGTTLNFTIYFDYYLADGSVNPDSPVVHVTTGNPGAVEEYYTYYTVGNCTTYPVEDDDSYYVIRVEVDDGVSPPAAPGYLLLWVFDNTAPYFTLAPPASLSVDWGEEVAVSFTVADYDDDPLEAVWDFGDGTTAEGVAVWHTYAQAGDYHVVLDVTDSTPGSCSRSRAEQVLRVNTPPTATLDAPGDGCAAAPMGALCLEWLRREYGRGAVRPTAAS